LIPPGRFSMLRYALAIVAVILIGTGLKWAFFSAPSAEADTPDEAVSMSTVIQKMQANIRIEDLPVQFFDAH
jgi:hypothetical protein